MYEEIRCRDIFEPALSTFCERRAEGTGHDYVIGRLGKDGLAATRDVGFGGSKVVLDLGETSLCLEQSAVCMENSGRSGFMRKGGKGERGGLTFGHDDLCIENFGS